MLNIHESQIQDWIKSGVQEAVRKALGESYGAGANIKKTMDRAIAESEPQILAAIKLGISQACMSPSFMQAIEAELVRSLGNKFKGAFDAVITAAARRAADDKLIAERVAQLAAQGAAIPTTTSTNRA